MGGSERYWADNGRGCAGRRRDFCAANHWNSYRSEKKELGETQHFGAAAENYISMGLHARAQLTKEHAT